MFDPINPLGTDGFEFVEYTAADAEGITKLKQLFVSLGFTEVAQHRSKQAWLYKQGDINFIVNGEPNSQAEAFAASMAQVSVLWLSESKMPLRRYVML